MNRQQRRAMDRKGQSPDAIPDGKGGHRLNAQGIAKLMIATARTEPDPQRSTSRKLAAELTGVSSWEAVEALAQSHGEGFVIDSLVAAIETRPEFGLQRPMDRRSTN